METNFQYCANRARGHDPDVYFCILLGPRAQRRASIALLAYNAELDRIASSVSEAMLGEIRLEWWREAIVGIKSAAPRRHPVVEELAHHFAETPAILEHLNGLIDARAVELAADPLADEVELLRYVDGVGGALHRAMLNLAGGHDLPVERAATAVGTGWALLRLIIALAKGDAVAQNLVPAAMRRAAGIRQGRFFDDDAAPGRAKLGAAIATLAAGQFDAAREDVSRIPRKVLSPLLPLVMGEAQLSRFAHLGHDPARFDPDRGIVRRQLRAMLVALRLRF